MIKNRTPVSMAEVEEILKDTKTENKELSLFIKKFIKINIKDAKKIKNELKDLKIIKIKDEDIIKVIDILPEDSSDLNKIFNDVSLDENEKEQILNVIKKYQ